MTHPPSEPTETQSDDVVQNVQRRAAQRRRSQQEGEPTLARQFARIGVLGWLIVIPTLLGLALGRWLDGLLDTQLMFSGALLLAGLALGCWSGWRWMHDA